MNAPCYSCQLAVALADDSAAFPFILIPSVPENQQGDNQRQFFYHQLKSLFRYLAAAWGILYLSFSHSWNRLQPNSSPDMDKQKKMMERSLIFHLLYVSYVGSLLQTAVHVILTKKRDAESPRFAKIESSVNPSFTHFSIS